MLITKTSILSGKTRTKEINVNQSQIDKWVAGMLIQDAMPDVSVDEREFIMTGITSEEWSGTFNDSNEEEHFEALMKRNILMILKRKNK